LITFILSLIIFLPSCDTSETISIQGKELKVRTELKNKNLYIPFKVVKSGEKTFILDKDDDRIKVFNEKGKLLNTIGEKGEAPGQYTMCTDFCIYEGKAYILAPQNLKIYIYSTEGEFLESIKLDIYSPFRFVLTPKGMFVSSLTYAEGQKIIHCFKKGEKKPINSFLECIPLKGLDFGKIYENMGWLAAGKEKIYFAYALSNKVLEFSFEGKLLKEHEIPLKPIKNPEFEKKGGEKKRMILLKSALNWDLRIKGDNVYLLSRDRKGNSIIFSLKEGKVIPKFKIKEELMSFDIYGDIIIGINENAEVLIYRI